MGTGSDDPLDYMFNSEPQAKLHDYDTLNSVKPIHSKQTSNNFGSARDSHFSNNIMIPMMNKYEPRNQITNITTR